MKIAVLGVFTFLLSISAFADSPAQNFIPVCQFNTSTVRFTKYELIEFAKIRPFTLCVDDTKFSKYELSDLQDQKIALVLFDRLSAFSKYDLADLGKPGEATLVIQTSKFSKYDLRDLTKSLNVVLFVRNTPFSKYDLNDLKATTRHLIFESSDTRFSKYDLLEVAKGALTMSLIVNDTRFSKNEIDEFAKAGILLLGELPGEPDPFPPTGKWECHLTISQTNLSRYEMLDLLKTRKLRICVDTNSKYSRYEIADFQKAGAELVLQSRSGFSKYELLDFLENTAINYLQIDTTQFSRYEIAELIAKAKVTRINDGITSFTKYELLDFAKKGKLILEGNFSRFSKYELQELMKAGILFEGPL